MTRLIYAHDGRSVYDKLFLKSMKEKYDLYFLTFHHKPIHVPFGVKVVKLFDLIPEIPLHPFEGIRMHALAPARVFEFRRGISKIRPDAVIGCWAFTYGFYAANSNFHPSILFIWGSDVLIYPQKFPSLQIFIKYALRKADLVVVDSDVQKTAVIKLGCSGRKIFKFPWVDLEQFNSEAISRLEIRQKLDLSKDDIVIISLRNHNHLYGVNYLIEAIPLVIRQEQNVKFLILGEGELTGRFKEYITKSGLKNYVSFLGKVPHEEVSKFLKASDIYVSTSLSDGTSASLLEAMACSLSSIVTDIPGNREWIREGENGFLIPTNESRKLAQRIVQLVRDNRLRKQIGWNASKTVELRVNWKRNMEVLDVMIEELISQNASP